MFSGTYFCKRMWSFVAGAAVIAIAVIIGLTNPEILIPCIVGGILGFFLVSCLILGDNCVGDVVLEIYSWSFVKLPGLIFTLDLDGIIWLLTVKLLFFILGLVLAILLGILALVVGAVVAVFVYPFALYKNIKGVA